jgi:hypothetical protein
VRQHDENEFDLERNMNCFLCWNWCATVKNENWIWREHELYLMLVRWHDDE